MRIDIGIMTRLALLGTLLLSGCLAPRPWWEPELEAWVGASTEELESVWGAPHRTILSDNGNPVHVYESHTTRDQREDVLGDPNRIISDDPPRRLERIEEFECMMFFEVADDTVIAATYEGAGCEVISRDPRHRSPRRG